MESRQVRRARERHHAKTQRPNYLKLPFGGGPSTARIHRNRKHRGDGKDYFGRTSAVQINAA